MDTARVFVGCSLDLAATRRAVDAGRALRKALDAAGWRCAWVPPANLHVTLRFLGDIDVGTAPALSAALARVARAHPALRLCPRGLLALPSPEAPRVLALDFAEGAEALGALARAVDDACFELGFARDPRPFRPHLTLCRVKHQGAPLEGATPRLDAGVATASELTLARSDLTRMGAEHHALSRHPLSEARASRPEGARPPRGQSTST